MRLRAAYDRFVSYLMAVLVVGAVAVGFHLARGILDDTLVALLFLIPVGTITGRWGLGPGIAAALTAFLAFNYLFITPYYTFTVHHPGDLVVLLVFLIVAAVMSQLVARARAAAEAATDREREATQLYELSTALAGPRDSQKIAAALVRQLLSSLNCQYVTVGLSGRDEPTTSMPETASTPERSPDLVVPIRGMKGILGEIRLWRESAPITSVENRLVRTFASQGALALERAALAVAEDRAKLLEESDRLKSSLLSSVSHDLRTPLATIKAAASSLRSGEISWDSPTRTELLAAVDDEADHLNLLVGNLLDMSKIESGALRPRRQWNMLSEIVATVLARMRQAAETHRLLVEIPEDLPLVPVDFVEMEQVFTNLISNSTKYAPPGTPIRITARVQDPRTLLVEVANNGPHVPEEHLERIFDKFYRITAADRVTGTGLGLSICKGIIEAHGGRIWAVNVADGLAFNFTLPLVLDGTPPPEIQPEAG
jgi:two-component system sensor histidine kinase KdpD